MNDFSNMMVIGKLKIFDPDTSEVFIEKNNQIHYENISQSLAYSLANNGVNDASRGKGFITEMAFGNGGSSIDPTGVITYLPPNVTEQNAALYNQTYSQQIKTGDISVIHTPGTVYTDILVKCILGYGVPLGANPSDNGTAVNGEYVFDEIGLKSGIPQLITHVIFHPVQKSLNRQIQINYTVRIQTLTNLSSS